MYTSSHTSYASWTKISGRHPHFNVQQLYIPILNSIDKIVRIPGEVFEEFKSLEEIAHPLQRMTFYSHHDTKFEPKSCILDINDLRMGTKVNRGFKLNAQVYVKRTHVDVVSICANLIISQYGLVSEYGPITIDHLMDHGKYFPPSESELDDPNPNITDGKILLLPFKEDGTIIYASKILAILRYMFRVLDAEGVSIPYTMLHYLSSLRFPTIEIMGFIGEFAYEFAYILVRDKTLNPLYFAALENPAIGLQQIEIQLAFLLKRFAQDLKAQAKTGFEKGAVRLIRSHRKRISAHVCLAFVDIHALAICLRRTRGDDDSTALSIPDVAGADLIVEIHEFLFSSDAYKRLRQNLERSAYRPHKFKALMTTKHNSSDTLSKELTRPYPRLGRPVIISFHKKMEIEADDGVCMSAPIAEDVKTSSTSPGFSVKRYFDNEKTIKFVPSIVIPPPRLGNRIKAVIEDYLHSPIIWWPLSPIDTNCPKGHTRVAWDCVCGTEIYVDLSEKAARDYAQHLRKTKIVENSSSNQILKSQTLVDSSGVETTQEDTLLTSLASSSNSILPLHTTSPSASPSSLSTSDPSSTSSSTEAPGHLPQGKIPINKSNRPIVKDNQQMNIIQDKVRDRYLHWCVDSSSIKTRLFHLEVPRMNDAKIIQELKTTYNSVKRFWGWFSLTECYGVKFVTFERIDCSEELVACGPEELPPLGRDDYVYKYVDPREQFLKTLEKLLMHRFHSPCGGCSGRDTEDLFSRIPMKVNGQLEKRMWIKGYGMHAIPGYAFWKLFAALLLSQIPPVVFAGVWLRAHPNDLQNAFLFWGVLSTIIIGILNILLILPNWSLPK
ncbi:serine/threonine protein kinase [Phlyctema vagabunda]|uniref:Serine/threonine protein kinase n=1 Tax=Phlyctema vagabunda TaxID=108571 RepID=A0ABR4P5A7_9HELO